MSTELNKKVLISISQSWMLSASFTLNVMKTEETKNRPPKRQTVFSVENVPTSTHYDFVCFFFSLYIFCRRSASVLRVCNCFVLSGRVRLQFLFFGKFIISLFTFVRFLRQGRRFERSGLLRFTIYPH